MKTAAPELVALIFAVWTLHHSKKFLQNMDASDKSAYLFQPHPVQVLCVCVCVCLCCVFVCVVAGVFVCV